MADDAITRGSIGGLGSPVYIYDFDSRCVISVKWKPSYPALIQYLTHVYTIYIFQNTFTGTIWLPDEVGQDVTEQNPYVLTAGVVAKNLTVKFF